LLAKPNIFFPNLSRIEDIMWGSHKPGR
jgi:hypothetical protein